MKINDVIKSALQTIGKFFVEEDYDAYTERSHAIIKNWIYSIKWLYDLYAASNAIPTKEIGSLEPEDEFPYDTSFASMAAMFACAVLCPEVSRYKEIYDDMSNHVRILCSSEIGSTVSRYA